MKRCSLDWSWAWDAASGRCPGPPGRWDCTPFGLRQQGHGVLRWPAAPASSARSLAVSPAPAVSPVPLEGASREGHQGRRACGPHRGCSGASCQPQPERCSVKPVDRSRPSAARTRGTAAPVWKITSKVNTCAEGFLASPPLFPPQPPSQATWASFPHPPIAAQEAAIGP